MGLRYFRRIHAGPFLTFNLSRSGVSTSIGPHGLHLTIGPRGTSESISAPGTGLYWTERQSAPRRGSGGLGWLFKLVALALTLAVALLIGTILGR